MSSDPDVTARIDHLLRTDARLCDAAPLIGRIPAIVTEPKPERKPRKRRAGKKPPPRVDAGEDAADLDEREDEEDETVVPTGLPPWLKVARAKTVSPQMRAALGAEALAYIAIDGGLWERLNADLQDRALILAIRPLVWSERKADGGDVVRRTQPPLQCHPDTAEDLSELVAALTDDPEEAATGARAAESLAGRFIHDEGPDPQDGDEVIE